MKAMDRQFKSEIEADEAADLARRELIHEADSAAHQSDRCPA